MDPTITVGEDGQWFYVVAGAVEASFRYMRRGVVGREES
jgi:hypothetical protein